MRNYTIRTMQKNELDFAIELAASERWNPGLYDKEAFFAADPNGFFIGFLDDEPMACLSAVKYSDTFGFIGLYIVKQPYRGQGYGIALWNAGMAYLSGCNVGLDGVVAQQHNYKKSGFQLAYRNMRYQGTTGGEIPANVELIELAKLPFSAINLYDRMFFPADRSAFLQAWLTQPESIALGIQQNNQLVGYGMIRRCRLGYKIGPLFADSFDDAEALFLALKARVKSGEPVYLDIPETNPNALALVEKYGMSLVFETARMYTQDFPALPLERLYGVTSFELG